MRCALSSVFAAGFHLHQGDVQRDGDDRSHPRVEERVRGRCEQTVLAAGRDGTSAARSDGTVATAPLSEMLDARYQRRSEEGVASHLRDNSRRTYSVGWRAWLGFATENCFSALLEGDAEAVSPRRLAVYFAVHLRATRFTAVDVPIKAVTIDQYLSHVGDHLVMAEKIGSGDELRSQRLAMLLAGYRKADTRDV